MKKTKLLTSLAALALVVSLGACEVNVDVGDVDIDGGDSSDTTDTEPEGTTPSESEEDTSSSSSTPEEPPAVTYTYSVEVTNADALKELTYDGNAASQTGVDLTINLVTTSSTGDVTTDTASADDVTLTPASDGVITVSGLTVTPVAAGDTTLTITWTEGNVSTTADVTVTDVTVSTPEPTPTEPTSWSEYLEANADGDHIVDKATIDAFLDGDLDEIIPYVASEIGYQFILISETEGRASFKVSDSDSGPATNAAAAWKTAIIDFGYTDLGGSTYQNEAGYKVEFEDWSFIGDFTVYVYPIEQVQEGPTTWEEFINNDYDWNALTTLLGATLDDVLPFYYEEQGYSNRYVTSERFDLYYYYPADGFTGRWAEQLVAFGYTEVDPSDTFSRTFVKDGYTVDLTDYVSLFGMWDLYLYPPVDTGDEGSDNEDLETAQAILNAAAAQTNGYQGFECVNVQARWSGGSGQYNHYNFDLTTDDSSNVYGREIRHDEDGDDETKFRTRYYYEKYYYEINNTTGANTHSAAASNSYNGVNRVLTWRLGAHDYDVAFDNASSIALESATDFELTTEANGNYKLTFVYNNTWYCYKADTNLNLVGAGHAINWSDSNSYEIYYGEEESENTLNALMEAFFADEYWFPKEASDEDIASDILAAVQGSTPEWTAFYGEAVDEWDVYTTEYLTTDEDGNLYGYKNEYDDWEETTETSYYYGGAKCVYNYSGVAQTPGEVYITYEEELEYFTYPLTISFNLSSDPYTLTALDDGYELTVAKSTTYYNTYTFTVDASYNLLAIDRDTMISPADEIVSSHVEGITYADVEAFIATTNFNPADFGFGEGDGDEATPSWADYMTESSYNTATSTLGATLDEVLPVVLPDGADYAQISASSSRVQLDASYWDYGNCPYDYDALNEAWDEALIADGWSCTYKAETTDSVNNPTYATYTKDGYQVEIQYYELYEGAGMWGWDLNLTVIK